MKKQAICLATGLGLIMMTGLAQASLTTIGTANYLGSDYNLIWDDDNNGNSVVWLDYSNDMDTWQNQTNWATSLDSAITINTPGYNVTWDDESWRLPYAGIDGNNIGFGYEVTTSEMGHLYYVELGNVADGGLQNIGDFNNLIEGGYETGFYWAYPGAFGIPADFHMSGGYQHDMISPGQSGGYGLAIRSAQVSSAVPVPGAIWLLGPGLAGLVGMRGKR